MADSSLVLQQRHHEQLKELFSGNDLESVAYLLCGVANIGRDPWTREPRRKYLSFDVVTVDNGDVVSASETHVRTRTRTLARVLKRAAADDLAVAVVHSHPTGCDEFSEQDDQDEPFLVELAQNRNGSGTPLLSVVLARGGGAFGRVWSSTQQHAPLTSVLVVGDRIQQLRKASIGVSDLQAFDRQVRAFGPALTSTLRALRFGVVGCGATGSAVCSLLGRLGVKRLAVFDRDRVEITNLNRLHGATMEDVESEAPKVDVMRRMVEGMGLGAEVVAFQNWVDEPVCRDTLLSCDVVFGCTDDHDGRTLLNRLAYYYLVPVFDVGFVIGLGQDEPFRVLDAAGRLTVLCPGSQCLLCRNVIDREAARAEQLQRRNPDVYAEQVEECYVRGGGNPDPAVVTFTTEVACMAVDELLHRITGYKACGSTKNRVRKFHLGEDKTPGASQRSCSVCETPDVWGRGDVEPFLGRVG